MTQKRLAKFEQRIAQLVEGSFARLFADRLHPQEVVTRLARAMEENALSSYGEEMVAPNVYRVRLNPDDCTTLLDAQPGLALALGEKIIALAEHAALRLLEIPHVEITSDPDVPAYAIMVDAHHIAGVNPPTESMKPVPPPDPSMFPTPRNPQLIVQGSRYVILDRPVMNIGRRHDNHIVIDDPRVSRAHAQLRIRFGRYVLYDLGSKSGTLVNQRRIVEYPLHPGDVISLAGVHLVYVEDDMSSSSEHLLQTDALSDTQTNTPELQSGPPTL